MADLEAAARGLFEHDRVPGEPPWEGLTEADRDSYRSAAGAVLAAAGNGEVVRRDAAAYQELLTLLEPDRMVQVRLVRDRAYAGEDVVGVRLHIGAESTPMFEVSVTFAAILDGLVRDMTRARNLVAALTREAGP